MEEIAEHEKDKEALRELEAGKQAFYRRTILAATEGKLLIAEKDEIGKLTGPAMRSWSLDSEEDLQTVIDAIFRMARESRMSEQRSYEFIGCVTEAVTNVLKHADRGSVSLHKGTDDLICVVSDSGPGIGAMALPDVPYKIIQQVGTLGHGLQADDPLCRQSLPCHRPDGTTVAIDMKLSESPANCQTCVPPLAPDGPRVPTTHDAQVTNHRVASTAPPLPPLQPKP